MAFKEWGSGQPLFLLHGFGGSVMQWHEHAEAFSKNYRVVVPNLNHFFGSKKPMSFTHQVEHLILCIENFSKQYGVINLVGVSYGAALAWAIAILKPEFLDRIVFINPMPPWPIQQFRSRWLRLFLRSKIGVLGVAIMLSTPMGQTFLREMISIFRIERLIGISRKEKLSGRKLLFVASLIQRFSWVIGRENWERWMDCWTFPSENTLIIYDSEDPLFKKGTYDKLKEQFDIQNAVILENAGHMAILTQPQKSIEIISNFFNATAKNNLNKKTG
jgi:pimeloyl-ACP methyl ester carboxylesterase